MNRRLPSVVTLAVLAELVFAAVLGALEQFTYAEVALLFALVVIAFAIFAVALERVAETAPP